MGKIYSNKAEEEFRQYAELQGWTVTKQGWPDFLVLDKKGRPIGAVEVKQKKSHREYIEGVSTLATTKHLKYQKATRDYLVSKGIPVKVWTPKDKFGN